MTISFDCEQQAALDDAVSRKPSSSKKDGATREYKIPPWMISYATEQSLVGNGDTPASKSTSFFFPSLGYNSVDYSEGDLKSSFSNAYVSLRYRQIISRPSWYFDAEAKFGALSLSNSIEDTQAQILDVDLRLGRAFQLFNEPWHFTLFAGVFYTQMLVTDDRYGYQGLYYPQLYPELRRIFASGNSMSFFLKIVPTGKSFLEFNEDLAATLGFQYNLRLLGQDAFFNMNHSRLKYKATNETPVEINQTSLGLGLGF